MRSVIAIESAARVWRDYVDATVAQGQRLASEVDRLLGESNRLLGASSRRTRILIAIAAAIVSLALIVILLEISISDGSTKDAGEAVVEATPIPPPVAPTEVQPVQPLAALMGAAPDAEQVRTLPVESSAALRVPLPRPRPLPR